MEYIKNWQKKDSSENKKKICKNWCKSKKSIFNMGRLFIFISKASEFICIMIYNLRLDVCEYWTRFFGNIVLESNVGNIVLVSRAIYK